jgi:hypothetical protein
LDAKADLIDLTNVSLLSRDRIVTSTGMCNLHSSKESAKGLDEVPCTNDTMLLASPAITVILGIRA